MSKSLVKKALEMLDDEDRPVKTKKGKKNLVVLKKDSTRKELARTCSTLKKLSSAVVSNEQIEQLNNYRFRGPSKRDAQQKKKKDKEGEEEVFTAEDFERFAREYNPPLQKS